MENPFDGIDLSGSSKSKLLEPDVYIGKLKEVKKQTMKKPKEDGSPNIKLVFYYDLPTESTVLPEFFNISVHEKSMLYARLKGILGAQFTDEIRLDRAKLWATIQSLIGQSFKLTVVQNQGYNNIASVIPQRVAKSVTAAELISSQPEVNI